MCGRVNFSSFVRTTGRQFRALKPPLKRVIVCHPFFFPVVHVTHSTSKSETPLRRRFPLFPLPPCLRFLAVIEVARSRGERHCFRDAAAALQIPGTEKSTMREGNIPEKVPFVTFCRRRLCTIGVIVTPCGMDCLLHIRMSACAMIQSSLPALQHVLFAVRILPQEHKRIPCLRGVAVLCRPEKFDPFVKLMSYA